MTPPLTGKVAFVTGSSGGFGRAIALELAREGCELFLSSIEHMPGSETAETAERAWMFGRRVVWFTMGHEDEDLRRAVDTARREFGRIDILVLMASFIGSGPITTADVSYLETYLWNVREPFLLHQLAAPVMAEGGGGVIVNLISGRRDRTPSPLSETLEQKASAALAPFNVNIAEQLRSQNVSVVSISAPPPSRLDNLELMGEIDAKAVAYVCKDPMQHNGHVYVARELVEKHGL